MMLNFELAEGRYGLECMNPWMRPLTWSASQVEAVVGVHNNAKERVNVTAIVGSLNNAQAFHQFYQNFTYQVSIPFPHHKSYFAASGITTLLAAHSQSHSKGTGLCQDGRAVAAAAAMGSRGMLLRHGKMAEGVLCVLCSRK